MSERVELVWAAKGDRRYAISDKVVDLRVRSNRICHRLPPTADRRVDDRLRSISAVVSFAVQRIAEGYVDYKTLTRWPES